MGSYFEGGEWANRLRRMYCGLSLLLRSKQHFGEIKNEVFFKERGLLCLKGPVG